MDDEKPKSERLGLLAKGLRAATIGAASLLFQAMAPASGSPAQPIIDRARARADDQDDSAPTVDQLVMQQGGFQFVIGGHRSHSSHSSHSSHVSGGGGSTYYPPVYVPPKKPKRTYLAPEPTIPSPRSAPESEAPKATPIQKKTTLRVKATPRARVFINGKEVGLTPTGPIEIASGDVEVRLVHKLLGEKVKRLVVNYGAAEEITIDW